MKNYNYLLIILIGFLTQQTFAQSKPRPLTEEDFYEIKTLPIPDNIKLEIGGVAPMPDGRLGVCTRRGEVWVYNTMRSKVT